MSWKEQVYKNNKIITVKYILKRYVYTVYLHKNIWGIGKDADNYIDGSYNLSPILILSENILQMVILSTNYLLISKYLLGLQLRLGLGLKYGLGLRWFLFVLVSNNGVHGPIATSCSVFILQVNMAWRG
jgi:hypothetical protein